MTGRWRWAVVVVCLVVAAVCGATCSSTSTSTSSTGGPGGASGVGGATAAAGFSTTSGGTFSSGTMSTATSTGSGGPMCDPTSCGAANGMCVNNVCTISENSGNVSAATKALLDAGGSADPAFKWLYPYDATVFPRGLLPPTMQFGGTAPTAMKVVITSSLMSYTGYFGASSPARVTLSAADWKAITLHALGSEDVKVAVTKVTGSQVAGPVSESWRIAQGSLRGTIYYETYNSMLAGAVGIMKINPGSPQPTVVKSGCGNVCHTASADGSTLVAATVLGSGSASYDLKNNAATLHAAQSQIFVYGGVYPDGSFSISATHYRTWGGAASHLYDTHTGAQIPTPSWDSVIQHAAMPAFSPDGKFLTFNRFDADGGHTISTMQYDSATKSFSALANVATDPARYLGWPAFTPDSKWIVYHAGSNPNFETDSNAAGDLMLADASSHQTARLDALDGYSAGGGTYLPANDPDLNFAPTVLPEAVGGYFWVVFTSHRSYGNTLPSKAANDVNGKVWVAALDLAPTPGKDASHPAFYLDGQELNADNLRGFWVLDPCMSDGNTCVTGDQCCGGFCTNGSCASNHTGCSQEFDKCSTAADCCNPADLCINGHCAAPPPM